jgi:hypothetical protein
MKIKDITFREDAKVTAVDPGKKTVTYTDTSTNISTTVPDTMAKPTPDGAVAVDTKAVADAGAGEVPKVTVGANVKDLNASESQGDDPENKHYHDWLHSEHSPYSDEAGDEDAVFQKAIHFLHKHGVHPGDIEYHAHHMTKKFLDEIDETHQDLVSQGDHDVGGDASDNYIDQVVDKGYERANRGPSTGSVSTISEKKLKESDELYKWLTIAGIK